MEDRIQQLERQVSDLQFIINKMVLSDKFYFDRNVVLREGLELKDGKDIILGTNVGTTIGGSASNKIAFYDSTPVVQYSAITFPTGGGTGVTDAIDVQCRTKVENIIAALRGMGIIDT